MARPGRERRRLITCYHSRGNVTMMLSSSLLQVRNGNRSSSRGEFSQRPRKAFRSAAVDEDESRRSAYAFTPANSGWKVCPNCCVQILADAHLEIVVSGSERRSSFRLQWAIRVDAREEKIPSRTSGPANVNFPGWHICITGELSQIAANSLVKADHRALPRML